MTIAEDPYAPALLWKQARNRALETLDMEWARETMPNASSDEVRLMALHKARYECTGVDAMLRLDSAEWLRARGLKRMHGHELLPEGELP